MGEYFHRLVYVPEELLVPRTQVIQAGLAIGCVFESVPRAFALARKQNVALATCPRQRVVLVPTKLDLLLGSNERRHLGLRDVAQQIVGVDEVVAGIEIPVVLEGEGVATGRFENAHSRRGHAIHLLTAASKI